MGEVAVKGEAAQRPLTPTEETVAQTWATELRLPQVGIDEDFIDLGSHSLQGLAIVARLETVFGIAIPVRTLFEEPTVADLAAWIDQRRGARLNGSTEIVRLQEAPGSTMRPIFALPGGRGDGPQLYGLAKLARELDPARPLYAFPGDPPAPESTEPAEWLRAAAAALVASMREMQPAGPFLLLGVCAGGVLAWEMASQLESADETVHLLLIDTRNPQFQIGEGTFRHAVTDTLTPEERRARRRRRREWRKDGVADNPGPAGADRVPDGARRVVMTRAYRPVPLRGRVTLLVNRDWYRVSRALGWDGLAGDLDVVAIGRGHRLEWHVPEVAEHVRAWLDDAERDGEALPRPNRAMVRERGDEADGDGPGTIVAVLDHWAAATPDAPALNGVGGEAYTYRELADDVDRLALRLRELGVGRQTQVQIVLPDGPVLAVAVLASISAGIAAPLAWSMTRHEYAAAMAAARDRVVLLPSGIETPAREAAAAAGLPVFEASAATTHGRTTLLLGGEPIGPAPIDRRPEPDDMALVIHSSGTTGCPKRIPRTHRNVATTSADVARVMSATARDRCLGLAPMAYSQGLNALLNTLWSGGSVLALPGFDLARFPRWIEAFRPTCFSATPAVLRAISGDDAASAAVRKRPPRLIRASAGAVSAADIRELEERLRAPVVQSFGMSEASFIAAESIATTRRKRDSVGRPLHDVAIVAEDGQVLPAGTTGEIVVRGPNVFPGYLDDPHANAEAFLPDGWLRTGDVGWLDDEGNLFVTGRRKELIKRGGLAISPGEVESALLADPVVADACAFGVPHDALGEDVVAAVVIRPGKLATERVIRERVATRLSAAKVPRAIVFVAEIPRTATGKALRRELAAAFGELMAVETPQAQHPPADRVDDALAGRVAAIWSETLGTGSVGTDDDLFDLGADSLQIARMLVNMQQTFARELPPSVLFERRTPAGVAAWIASHQPADSTPPDHHAASRQFEKPGIFLVSRAAGGGKNPLRASRLGEAIDPERPVHDLIVPTQLAGATTDDAEELARTAAICIATARAEQSHGPYLIVGIGDGGSIAREMARLWEREGEVAHVLLIDTSDLVQPLGEHAAGPRIVSIDPGGKPRRNHLKIVSAMRTWLQEIEQGEGVTIASSSP